MPHALSLSLSPPPLCPPLSAPLYKAASFFSLFALSFSSSFLFFLLLCLWCLPLEIRSYPLSFSFSTRTCTAEVDECYSFDFDRDTTRCAAFTRFLCALSQSSVAFKTPLKICLWCPSLLCPYCLHLSPSSAFPSLSPHPAIHYPRISTRSRHC
jgi:hypothetical protein